MHFGCRSRYISRYAGSKFDFLPFVVATIVAIVFLRRICSSRPGDGEQRGQSLAALTARGRGLDCFQPQSRLPTVRFSLAGSSLPGPRARRARFLTCGVIRVADIKLSRYKGENISLLSLPKKQPCEYQIWRKKLHKFFERSYRANRMNPKYRN